jgi:hypothetical protein
MAGFNDEIAHKGTFFHVQTQDLGRKFNCIESTIYKSGKFISSKKTSYTSYLNRPDIGKEIEQLLEKQHQTIIKEITDGKFDHL